MLVATEHLGRTVVEASAAVGLSSSGGSKMLSRSRARLRELEPLATDVATWLRRKDDA